MRKQFATVAALALGLGFAGTAWGARTDYHAQSSDPCAVCHSLASAKGWVDSAVSAGANWLGREGPVKCYTCHQGVNAYEATNQVPNAFGNSAAGGVHMYDSSQLPPNTGGEAMTIGSFFYRATEGNVMDCITCHDVHSRNVRPYLSNATSMENLCIQCHGRTWSGTKAAGNTSGDPADPRSTHPQGVTYTFTGNNGENYPTAFVYRARGSATDITPARDFSEVVNLTDFTVNWTLGAHTQSGADATGAPPIAGATINCQTCHVVHGGDDYAPDASGVRRGEQSLLVADIVGSRPAAAGGADTTSPVCMACHRGGDTGETVQPSSLSLTATDHPIGVRNLTYILINRRALAADSDASNGNSTGSGWNRYWGGASGTGEVPVCVTCHDIHGGMNQTALYRVASQAYSPTGTQVAQTEDNWCFTCHADAGPVGHHSHKGNMATSQIQCEDCHGNIGLGGYQAHGDFFNGAFSNNAGVDITVNLPSAPNQTQQTDTILATEMLYNYKSGMCLLCHEANNPTAFRAYTPKSGTALTAPAADGTGGTFPARHGNLRRGNASHQVLRPDNDSIGQVGAKYASGGQDAMGITPATAAPGIAPAAYVHPRWSVLNGGATVNNFAKWGRDATVVGNGRAAAPVAAGDLIICESCHNIQYNDGLRRVANGAPNNGAVTLQNAGYFSNLLLGLYEDDWGVAANAPVENNNSAAAGAFDFDGNAATDSALCTWCHPFAAQNDPDAATSTTHIHGEPNGWLDWGGGLEVAQSVTNWGGATIAATNLSVYALRPDTDFPSRSETALPTLPAQGWLTWRSGASDWTKFDCDACHRPHNAATNSTMIDNMGASQAAPLITERAGAIDTSTPTLNNPIMRVEMCDRCHSVKLL